MKCFEKPTVRLGLLQETAMSDFKRSPSKVWWASESLEWREISGSPGSQDSGFSDTETSPPIPKNVAEQISKDLDSNKAGNLSSNYQEKTTPDKSIKQSPLYTKNSPRVSRNLFNTKDKRCVKDVVNNQYSKEVACLSPRKVRSFSEELHGRSYGVLNRSAPAVLEKITDEEETFNGNNSLSSDCESELECLFNGALESPKHTSTPKMRQTRNKVPLNLYLKYQQQEKREPLDNDAVQTWMTEIKHHYEQECMTTLQSKSIAGELHQKVANMATYTISSIKKVLAHSECIQREYKNLNSEKKHVGPLAQSLAGNIIDFIKTYSEVTPKLLKQYDAIRKTNEDFLTLVSQLFTQWETVCHTILVKEIKRLVDKLENPCSELDLRATITGITSLSLRNDHLIEIFTKNDIIPILLILCEKCEGSSMRSLLLRALSTMCSTAYAVRQFERFSGIQIVSDTLGEEPSRPEPERSEAVALLAQVTAPWIEDNHCIKGLQDYSRKLVKSLTKFLSTTKCCQNLLLCTAALANLSTMDNKCIKYVLHLNTIELLLEAVNRRGPCASIYLLEQVATLLANMTSLQTARQQLLKLKTIPALLCCLRTGSVGEDVEKRLQQKAIIALSRLCSEKEAAAQVVELGGVEKLVRMCREKNERFCNDAVLVATLATLRKIADACGRDVISVEDAQELVEPKLLDSFLAYSSQSESYV
ncbi:protein inscuteable homolog isoform X2 [Tribolium madens]|uniref:protein inscuteable homolog isoform X2 n=1 Tax=Tribolium madens TaxID=41895 RepID=UPI001CF7614F|nr:protein inscuteable homolog isoform X2 [Tribolium madens]